MTAYQTGEQRPDSASVSHQETAGEVRVVKPAEFDTNTPQTPGTQRVAAISHHLAGSVGLWAGVTMVAPGMASGVHHHGALETIIYVVSGQATIRWGTQMEQEAAVGPSLPDTFNQVSE